MQILNFIKNPITSSRLSYGCIFKLSLLSTSTLAFSKEKEMNLFLDYSMTVSLRNVRRRCHLSSQNRARTASGGVADLLPPPPPTNCRINVALIVERWNLMLSIVKGNCSAAVNAMSITLHETGTVHLCRVDSLKSLTEYSTKVMLRLYVW